MSESVNESLRDEQIFSFLQKKKKSFAESENSKQAQELGPVYEKPFAKRAKIYVETKWSIFGGFLLIWWVKKGFAAHSCTSIWDDVDWR